MNIAVAAETITPHSGLGHFLSTGLKRMADMNPTWRFHVVARRRTAASFREMFPDTSSVILHVWDEPDAVKWLRDHVRLRGRDRLIGIGARHAPGVKLRAALGNLAAVWESMPEYDAMWVPHFDISTRLSPILYKPNAVARPILFTIHDLQPAYFPQDWAEPALLNFTGGLSDLAQASAAIVTHTNFQKADIARLFDLDPGKIVVTPAPPLLQAAVLNDAGKTSDDGSSARETPRPFFLYPGSSGFSHKNHRRLLLAWALLKEELNGACPGLVCTCRGHQWPGLLQLVDTHGLGETVTFTGLVPLQELARLYRQSAGVIVPTLYEGGGSGPVAEAILANKAVLCSDIPTIREQITAYGTAEPLWFNPDDPASIADSVRAFLRRPEYFQDEARSNQRTLIAAEPRLWDEWASVYSAAFVRIAA